MYKLIAENKPLIENKSTDPIYALGVAAKLSETSIYSIRQYIDKGLLIPYTTAANRHLFSDVDISRLKCIKNFLTKQGLNVAGIKAIFAMVPCWVLRPCTENDRNNCDAYYSINQMCWEASNKSDLCMNTDCRICEVYRLTENCTDLKELIRKLV